MNVAGTAVIEVVDSTKPLTPLKAIREKCLDCMCGVKSEIKLCPITDCALYPFRLGKNPNVKREYTEEQRQAFRERMAKARDDAL